MTLSPFAPTSSVSGVSSISIFKPLVSRMIPSEPLTLTCRSPEPSNSKPPVPEPAAARSIAIPEAVISIPAVVSAKAANSLFGLDPVSCRPGVVSAISTPTPLESKRIPSPALTSSSLFGVVPVSCKPPVPEPAAAKSIATRSVAISIPSPAFTSRVLAVFDKPSPAFIWPTPVNWIHVPVGTDPSYTKAKLS